MTEWIAAWFRSQSDNRPAAPSSVPRAPTLVVEDEYIMADGVRFTPVARSEEFVAAVPTQRRIALRLPTSEYGSVNLELMRWFNASEYGEASQEYRAYRHAALACAGCGWEFPGSYTVSLLGMVDSARVVGGTSGFAEFGRTGECPRCGSRDSFLLYERIDPAEIGEEDVAALAGLWREDALLWWSRTGRKSGICDRCSRDMKAAEGYLISLTSLICERCLRHRLDGGLESLRADPYYYGSTELRRARPFRASGALPDSGAPGAYGVEHVLVLWDGSQPDAEELTNLAESVAPGSTAGDMSLETTGSPGLSRGLAYWRIYSDEVAGRLTVGAWRRARLTMREDDSGRRLVAVVAAGPDTAQPAPARQEWARTLIFTHMARMELELRQDLTDRPTWCRLLDPEVLDFVLDIEPGAAHPFHARTFGHLSVFVSLFDTVHADRIRDLMGGGWESHLDTLLNATGIRLGERDVAHWILCREPGESNNSVHFAYLPSAVGEALIVPVDLLAPVGPDTSQ